VRRVPPCAPWARNPPTLSGKFLVLPKITTADRPNPSQLFFLYSVFFSRLLFVFLLLAIFVFLFVVSTLSALLLFFLVFYLPTFLVGAGPAFPALFLSDSRHSLCPSIAPSSLSLPPL